MSAAREELAAKIAAARGETLPARKNSAADLIVAMFAERYDLARAEDGEPFAIERAGPNVARLFRGGRGSLRGALAAAYAERHGKVPPAQAIVDALAVLEGRALAAPRRTLPLRATRDGTPVLLDLGDESGAVIEVDAEGWRILARSPVTFRRSELTGALPRPANRGDLAALWALVNVAEDDLSLILAQLVAALLGVPVPILLYRGPAGAAKTTAARMHSAVIDPSPAPTRSAPKDPEGWAVAASGSFVVALDNIDTIPGWLSDALCRAVTGEAFVRRALYTDNSIAVLAFRRALILTAIDPGAMRGDLSDRLLAVDLAPIGDERRRDDAEIEAAFRAAHPAILAGLLDLTADVLRRLPDVTLTRRPRMADYGRVLAAVDGSLGTAGLARYMAQRGDLQREAAEGDRIGAAVLEWLTRAPGGWEGTAAELLVALTPDRPPKDWPTTPRALSGALRRVAQPLAAAGVAVAFDREAHTGRRLVRLERIGDLPSPPSPPTPPSVDAAETGDGSPERVTVATVAEEPTVTLFPVRGDAGDGSDGLFPLISGAVADTIDAPLCADCGKPKVLAPGGRFVCTNAPGHQPTVACSDYSAHQTRHRRVGAGFICDVCAVSS